MLVINILSGTLKTKVILLLVRKIKNVHYTTIFTAYFLLIVRQRQFLFECKNLGNAELILPSFCALSFNTFAESDTV